MGADEEDRYPYLIDVYKWIRHAFYKESAVRCMSWWPDACKVNRWWRLKKNLCSRKGITSVCLTDEGKKDPLLKDYPISGQLSSGMMIHLCLNHLQSNLAVSSGCIYQAFRIEKNAYGVQFHPEVTAEIVAAWTGKARQTEIFMNDFNNQYSEYEKISDLLLTNFLELH